MIHANSEIRILLTGGGTGGHLFPLVAVARSVKEKAAERGLMIPPRILFLGPDHFSRAIFTGENIETKFIAAGKLRRYFSFATLFDIVKLPISLLQSLWSVYLFMPDIVFSKGGYGSVFPLLASWFYRIPIIIHESDSEAGLANRICSLFARWKMVSFPSSRHAVSVPGAQVVGNPIREGILAGSVQAGRELFGIHSDRPVIFVQGGSQGAQAINELVLGALPALLARYEIIHQVGEKHFESVRDVALALVPEHLYGFYHPSAFLSEEAMAHAYAVCELVVSRAGSGTIFETAAVKKPSIIIPLPGSASDHQKKNAYIYSDAGCGEVLEETNLAPHIFVQRIDALMGDAERRRGMIEAATQFARPYAADEIAGKIFEFIGA